MKIKDLKDDEIVYVFTNKQGYFLGKRFFLNKQVIQNIMDIILGMGPTTDIEIFETVASDIPRDFYLYEKDIEKK